MRVRVWTGERECSGKVSLYRGPLLLAYEPASVSPRQRVGTWQSFGAIHASRDKGAAFEYDFAGTGVKWFVWGFLCR